MCGYDHCLIPEHVHHPKKKTSYPRVVTSHPAASPPALAATDPHSVFMDLLVIINNSNNPGSCLVPLLFKQSAFAGFGLTAPQVGVLESDCIILAKGKCHAEGRIWTLLVLL